MARPRKFDEQAVLTAARNVFWHSGYSDTTVQDLTEATGLGTQSLYGAFGSKHALFLRILDDYCTCQATGLKDAVTADPSPWRGLLAAVAFEDGGRLDLPPEGCLMASSTAALSSKDDEVRTRACKVYAQTLELFTQRIAEAQELGEIDADVDVQGTARALIAVMQGIEFLHKSGIDENEFQLAKTAVIQMIERSVNRP